MKPNERKLSLLQRAIRATYFWLIAKTVWQEEVVEVPLHEVDAITKPVYRTNTGFCDQKVRRYRAKVPLTNEHRRIRIITRWTFLMTAILAITFGIYCYVTGSPFVFHAIPTTNDVNSYGHLIDGLSFWWLVPIIGLTTYGFLLACLPITTPVTEQHTALGAIFSGLILLAIIFGMYIMDGALNVATFVFAVPFVIFNILSMLFYPGELHRVRVDMLPLALLIGLGGALMTVIGILDGESPFIDMNFWFGLQLFLLLLLLPAVSSCVGIAIGQIVLHGTPIVVDFALGILSKIFSPMYNFTKAYINAALDDQDLPTVEQKKDE